MAYDKEQETENTGINWLSKIVEGGLPQILVGPAGKAISRLVGVTVEIPAAYAEQIAQGIKDKTEARSKLSQVLSEQAALDVAGDTEIVQRAVNSMLARSYRSQVNKDEIAKVAIKDLGDAPAPATSEGPSDVWLDKFERYAEDASSEDLRTTFGKILAQEIRTPGSVPNSAMHFLSMLDQATAKLVSKIMPACVGAISGNSIVGFVIVDLPSSKLNTVEWTDLEHAGFCSSGKTFDPTLDTKGNYKFWINDHLLLDLKGNPNSEISLKVSILSKAGLGLLNAISPAFDKEGLRKLLLKNRDISEVAIYEFQFVDGKKIPVGGDSVSNPNFCPS